MLDALAGIDLIECMPPSGRRVFHGEPVSKLQAAVGQDFGDVDGRGNLQPAREVDAASAGRVAINVQEHPAPGRVEGHTQGTARGLAGHLLQVFDVDVNEAWFITLEGLFERECFAFCLRVNVL